MGTGEPSPAVTGRLPPRLLEGCPKVAVRLGPGLGDRDVPVAYAPPFPPPPVKDEELGDADVLVSQAMRFGSRKGPRTSLPDTEHVRVTV